MLNTWLKNIYWPTMGHAQRKSGLAEISSLPLTAVYKLYLVPVNISVVGLSFPISWPSSSL